MRAGLNLMPHALATLLAAAPLACALPPAQMPPLAQVGPEPQPGPPELSEPETETEPEPEPPEPPQPQPEPVPPAPDFVAPDDLAPPPEPVPPEWGRSAGASMPRAARAKRMDSRTGLEPRLISMVVRRNMKQIRGCYETQLKGKPDLEGRLYVKFTIDAQGKVQSTDIKGSAFDQALATCILEHLQRWEFPASPDGTTTTVSYPFVFKQG